MPKGVSKKTTEVLDELLKGQLEIAKTIESLSLRVQELESAPKAIVHTDERDQKIAERIAKADEQIKTVEMPIPQEYRKVINDTLNQKFGIDLRYDTGLPQFTFTIIVPDEYTNLTQQEKDIKKVDLRSCIVKYADGVNGVKMWADKVYNNFLPEVRAKIIADRTYA